MSKWKKCLNCGVTTYGTRFCSEQCEVAYESESAVPETPPVIWVSGDSQGQIRLNGKSFIIHEFNTKEEMDQLYPNGWNYSNGAHGVYSLCWNGKLAPMATEALDASNGDTPSQVADPYNAKRKKRDRPLL